MEFDINSVIQQAIEKTKKEYEKLENLNVIVAGKTGVGKSTLINAVFKGQIAEEETGMGKPVTKHMKYIHKDGIPLSVYDTRGFELGKDVQSEVKKEIISKIKNGVRKNNISEQIHCIWYCIGTPTNRIEPKEIEWIKDLSKKNTTYQVPIIIILTQSYIKDKAEDMKKCIIDENLDVIDVIPVLALDYQINEKVTIPAYGLDRLVDVMYQALPEEIQKTLQNVQIVNLNMKRQGAHAAIATATVTAAAIGAAPIPVADATLLVPLQITMIASITTVYGFDIDKSRIVTILTALVGAAGAPAIGKAVVKFLIKYIPGGNLINAATASAITAALGEAYMQVLELVFKGDMKIEDLSSKKGIKLLKKTFDSKFKLSKKAKKEEQQ